MTRIPAATILDAEPDLPTARIANPRLRQLTTFLDELGIHDLAAARVLLRDRELRRPNHYFNPDRAITQLRQYADAAPELFADGGLDASAVLEFGSGTRNALSVGALLAVNGAPHVTCYEPGRIVVAQSGIALRELLVEAARHPERFNVTSTLNDHIRSRAIQLLLAGSDPPGAPAPTLELVSDASAITGARGFDLILSNHVLEHVPDPEAEMRRLREVTAPDGRHVHRVDFRDHRVFSCASKGFSQFEFYRDGDLTTCNGLRPSDVETAFAGAGLSFEAREIQRVSPDKIGLVRADRFKRYSRDELGITQVDYVLARRL